MSRDELVQRLSRRKIDNRTYDRITELYPVSEDCPTCGGLGRYNLDFETHECDCQLQRLLQKHYFAANIGREYHDICLSDFDGPDTDTVVPVVREYIDNFDHNFHFGLGLTFTGPLGTGKTFAATCVLKELIKRGEDVYFITFEELINVWGKSWHDDEARRTLEKRLKGADVLALDELKTDPRNSGGFLANGLDSVIRHRTSNLLPTMVTTNMKPGEELDQFGKVYSLLAAKNLRVNTQGHDRRMREVRNRNFELAKRGERRPIC